jgi:hypothetical protein
MSVLCELWVNEQGDKVSIPYQESNKVLLKYKIDLLSRGYRYKKDVER